MQNAKITVRKRSVLLVSNLLNSITFSDWYKKNNIGDSWFLRNFSNITTIPSFHFPPDPKYTQSPLWNYSEKTHMIKFKTGAYWKVCGKHGTSWRSKVYFVLHMGQLQQPAAHVNHYRKIILNKLIRKYFNTIFIQQISLYIHR